MEAFNAACNYISEVAYQQKTASQIILHGLCYYDIREKFGLSSQMAVRAIGKVKAVYKRDKKVNKAQRRIRKQIVRHLTAQPESDMPACLAMMSVIKDAERLGDFSKNLLEVSEHYNGSFTEGKYITTFRQRFQEIREMFDKSCKAFVECDEEAAHEVVALKNIVSRAKLDEDNKIQKLLADMFGSKLLKN